MAKKANAAFMKPLTPSEKLAVVVGSKPLPRTEVVKKLWQYIKKHDLQDKKNRRNINADAALKAVFAGKATVNMFEMTKLVSKHLSKVLGPVAISIPLLRPKPKAPAQAGAFFVIGNGYSRHPCRRLASIPTWLACS